jgi:TPR repeat protein
MTYYHGYGVAKDVATARAWLQKAAARGYAPAKEMLAKLDGAGDSVPANAATDVDVSSRPARLQ